MRGRWRWLGTWWFLSSVALLALNDHALKAAHPGWLTGKLSDLVGPVVVATLVGLVVGRTPAVAATAVAFVALKTVPGVAELAAPLLGGVTHRDPSDVVGLVLLVPAWRLMGASTALPRRSTQVRERQRRVVATLASIVALFVATATSDTSDPEVQAVHEADGTVYAEIYAPDTDDPNAVSFDAGATWSWTARQFDDRESTAEVCRSDDWCFRAVGDAIEEREPGGSWRTSYALTSDEASLIAHRSWGGPEEDGRFTSVVVVDRAGESTVIGSAADQGIVVLGGSGEWERRSVLGVEPDPLESTWWMVRFGVVLYLVAGPASLIALLWSSSRGSDADGTPFRLGQVFGAFVVGLFLWVGTGASTAFVGGWIGADPEVIGGVLLVGSVLSVVVPAGTLAGDRRIASPRRGP